MKPVIHGTFTPTLSRRDRRELQLFARLSSTRPVAEVSIATLADSAWTCLGITTMNPNPSDGEFQTVQ